MNIIESIILGIVQGIGEFLPISSSAHLIFFRDILGVGINMSSQVALSFDIALHFGTLLALIVVFFKDFLGIAIEGLTKGIKTTKGKLMWLLVVATVPAALSGYFFEDYIDGVLRTNYLLIAILLAVVGIIIYLVDKYNTNTKELTSISFKEAGLIGVAQSLALVPGVSRSGATITMARFFKIKREDAAKFSFYLSAPIVLGAVIVTLIKGNNIEVIMDNLNVFITGIIVSFITGILCIKFLLNYLKNNDFKLFMWYRIIVALIMIIIVIF